LSRSNDESVDQVLWALRALGGEATLGDLVAVTGISRAETERALEILMARGRGHARVLDRGDLTYHLEPDRDGVPAEAGRTAMPRNSTTSTAGRPTTNS